jgi:hypothetical protein
MHRFGAFRSCVLMVRFTSVIIGLHLLTILLWAAFYRWNCFPSWESAFYLSAASYSTVEYGDLLLPRMWRILGPVESVTGVLMCGLSAGLLFAIVTRLVERDVHGVAPIFLESRFNPWKPEHDTEGRAEHGRPYGLEPAPPGVRLCSPAGAGSFALNSRFQTSGRSRISHLRAHLFRKLAHSGDMTR